MISKIKNGEIWLANLNPNRGVEPGKTRPVVVLQNQVLLDIRHPSTLIAPLTTQLIEEAYPLRLHVNARDGLQKSSDILIDQIRAIDNKRFMEGPLTILSQKELIAVYDAACEVLGMNVVIH